MQTSGQGDAEAALRDAVLSGDQVAWRRLYDGAFATLWAYVVWRCAGNRHLAEEIAQETWLIAVRRMRAFDPRRSRLQAWLRGIAAKVLQNHFRSVRRRGELARPGMEATQASVDERSLQTELIARSLADIPERHEAVLRAKYLDLLSVAQIAADWGETSKSIESLLTRARHSFRSAYENRAQDTLTSNESTT
jgi:RNA polymerase sigma-70 factor (ECF subfamily)